MVALKASTNGCGFFHTICSTYANMLHSRKFKSGDLGGHKSLPQKLGMFSLRYSRVFLPYDKVLHLLATHNLHHKVLFIHRSSCFNIGVSTDPFIWAPFATGSHHLKEHKCGKVLCLADQLHMIGNIQHWHKRNTRIVSLVENLFRMFT